MEMNTTMPHRGCKNIDITDPYTCDIWVMDCLDRHYKRHDFNELLAAHGCSEPYSLLDPERRLEIARNVAGTCCEQIIRRKLILPPVRISERRDNNSGKVRQIGCESALQQCLDFIIVGASGEIHSRRIVPQQCSSIKGRGPLYGAHMIEKWIKDDLARREYPARHGLRIEAQECRYHVKTDCVKCFPNGDVDAFMRLYSRDCGNPDMVWLFDTLLRSHKVDGYHGFMIGALPSEWAMQYLLSFAYRFTNSLHDNRGNKLIHHELLFMDDILYTGSNRKNMKKAIRLTGEYMADELHQYIKPNWSILKLSEHPIDMMGYRFYWSGKVAIRPKIYLRARRMALRSADGVSFKQAERIMSYKGFFVHFTNARSNHSLHLGRTFRKAKRTISKKYKLLKGEDK